MGETASKPKEEEEDDGWGGDPVYVVNAESKTPETEALHPDIENLQSIPTFMPLLRSGQLTDPDQPKMDPEVLDALHNDLTSHFTTLGTLTYKRQLRLFEGMKGFDQEARQMIPHLQKQKNAVNDLAKELGTVDQLQRTLAEVYASLQKAIVGAEALRNALPEGHKMTSFGEFLEENKEQIREREKTKKLARS